MSHPVVSIPSETKMPTIARPTNKKPKTIAGYPLNTAILLMVLTLIAAAVIWLRLFYRPSTLPLPSPTPLPDLPKISSPKLPESIISPLTISQVKLNLPQEINPTEATLLTSSSPLSLSTFTKIFAQKLGLSQSQNKLNQQIWLNPSSTLIANPEKNNLSYFLNSQLSKLGKSPDKSSANLSAQKFLTNIGIDYSKYSLEEAQTRLLFSSGLNFIPTKDSTNSADLVVLSYSYQINSLPTLSGQTEFPLQVKVGRNSQVVGFVYSPPTPQTTPSQEYPLVSIDKIPELLTQNFGRLISLEPTDFTKPPLSETISQFTINTLTSAYYYSPTQNLLYPSYLLKGNGTFSDGTQATLTFIFPAINPAYYK